MRGEDENGAPNRKERNVNQVGERGTRTAFGQDETRRGVSESDANGTVAEDTDQMCMTRGGTTRGIVMWC